MGEPQRSDGRGASQRRSRERREQLLRAALSLLESGGAKAITHRAVSDAAGLPSATAGYYFPQIDDLAAEAIAYHANERIGAIREAARRQTYGIEPTPLRLIYDTVERVAHGSPDVSVVDFELYLEAARSESFRPHAAPARRALERLCVEYFSTIGVRDVVRATQAHLALVEGFGLQQVAFGPDEVDVQMATNAFTSLFVYHRATDAERARMRASLNEPLPEALRRPRALGSPANIAQLSRPSGQGRGASQQRSRERREQLLAAAIRLFETSGSKAVTHRAVSQEANLPPATAGYYFPMIDDLLTEAVEFHVRERLRTITGMLDALRTGFTTPVEVLELSSRALATGGTGVGPAHFELFLEAARNPTFRPIAASMRRDFEGVAMDYVAQLGVRDVLRVAQIYLAFTDGVALQRLAFGGGDEAEIAMMVETLIGLVYFYRAGDAEQDEMRASLQTQLPAR